jgi:hypothetical protein
MNEKRFAKPASKSFKKRSRRGEPLATGGKAWVLQIAGIEGETVPAVFGL